MGLLKSVPVRLKPRSPPKGDINKQPQGLKWLLMGHFGEAFAHYGMRNILILFMLGHLRLPDSVCYELFSAFTMLIYAVPVLGSAMGDRLGRAQDRVLASLLFMILGYVLLTLSSSTFYLALGTLICGSGLYKPSVYTLLAYLYPAENSNRDSGYNLFLVSSNLGGVFGTLLAGYVARFYGWRFGFAFSLLGIALSLFAFSLARAKNIFPFKKNSASSLPQRTFSPFLLLIACPLLAFLLLKQTLINGFVLLLSFSAIAFMTSVIWKSKPAERGKLGAVLATIILVIIFETLFEQIGGSLNIFIERFADKRLGGVEIPTAWFLAINPTLVILLGLFFSAVWLRLARSPYNPTALTKFLLGFGCLAGGFLIFITSIKGISSQGEIKGIFMATGIFFLTLAELFIIPTSLAVLSSLAPKPYLSTFTGGWFLAVALAQYLAGMFAQALSAPTHSASSLSAWDYMNLFEGLLLLALATIAILFLLRPFLRALRT